MFGIQWLRTPYAIWKLISNTRLWNNCQLSTSREEDNETMAGVNSCFAKVTENDILQMQDITIPVDTKKATKYGMKVFRDKQCFNTLFAHMSSVFCPDRQAWLMPLSLNNSYPSTLYFLVPSKSTQLPLSKTSPFKKIWMPLSLFKMIVISNTPTVSTWHDFRRKLHKLFFQFLLQVNCTCLHGTTSRY